MADVFISYSQAARASAEALAERLGGSGIACWYDIRLNPNDVFWKVIMKQITEAKAVVTIWSRPALESEWVYSESMLAHRQKKLICVHAEDVDPADVPLPFNGYNITHSNEQEPILRALRTYGLVDGGRPVSPVAAIVTGPRQGLSQPSEGKAHEIAIAWDTIKAASEVSDLEDFLAHYGDFDSFIVRQAGKRLKRMIELAAPVSAAGSASSAIIPAAIAEPEIAAAETDVFLCIDPGMHTARINRITVTADGRMLATASYDKTVRLWGLPDGALIRTLRPRTDEGHAGKIYGVALDPEGKWVAVAGWLSKSGHEEFVTIFHTSDGAVAARLGPISFVIQDLEVSTDGRFLAAGLGRDKGLRVWSLQGNSWKDFFTDKAYGGDIFGLSFARDGRLAATSYDGHVRIYAQDMTLTHKIKLTGGEQPFGVGFSPDGSRLAIGYSDTLCIDILDASTFELLKGPDITDLSGGNISKVAWLSDGRLAAGGRSGGGRQAHGFIWENGGNGARSAWRGTDDAVLDLASLPSGDVAFCGADPAFGVVSSRGKQLLWRGPATADLRGKKHQHFLVSADGHRVRFGLKVGSDDPVLFDLKTRRLNPSPSASPDLFSADTTLLTIENWQNATAPVLKPESGSAEKAVVLSLLQHEASRSLAIAPGGKMFLLGTEWRLCRFDVQGNLTWNKLAPGATLGVNLAREGRLALAAYGDGTIRWHRAEDGEELLALFIHVPEDPAAEKRWVLFTPKGYYDCSPGADDLIGWHINRGPDEAAEFHPAHVFAATFKKPDIVYAALDGV